MGSRGWLIVGGAVAIVVGFFSWTWYLSPEARVERAVRAAGRAAETVDGAAFLAFFASDYSDYLHPDREAFARRIEEGFGRVDRLNVGIEAVEVDMEAEGATARFELVVIAFKGDDRFIAVGAPLQPELVIASMIRDDTGWKLARVERGIPTE